MVNVDGGWHEMKTGSIMSEYGRSTIATMERAEGFGRLLFAEESRSVPFSWRCGDSGLVSRDTAPVGDRQCLAWRWVKKSEELGSPQ